MAPPLAASLYCCWKKQSRSASASRDRIGSYTCQSQHQQHIFFYFPAMFLCWIKKPIMFFTSANLRCFQFHIFRFIARGLRSISQKVHKTAVPLSMLNQSFPMILHCDLGDKEVIHIVKSLQNTHSDTQTHTPCPGCCWRCVCHCCQWSGLRSLCYIHDGREQREGQGFHTPLTSLPGFPEKNVEY